MPSKRKTHALAYLSPLLVATAAAAQMPVPRVVVVAARVVEAQSTITLVATVAPNRRSRVSTEIAGLVRDVPIRQGDFVEQGGVIARLNDDIRSLSLVADKAKLNALRAEHAELVAGTRVEELRRLKAMLEAAEADVDRWTFEMQRIENLRSRGDSSAKEYTDTRAAFVGAQRLHAAAGAAYNLGVEGPRAETIDRALHRVAEQQAMVNRTAAELAKMVIRAPFSGWVVKRMVEVGEWVPLGEPIVELVDLGSVLIRVDVPESAFAYLAVGDAVRVFVDALKRSFTGRIKHAMKQADPTARTFPVEIEVDNPGGVLAGGMFARATVPAGPAISALAVPHDAIVERDGVAYVAIIMPAHDGKPAAMLTPVMLGADVGDLIAITAGNVREGTHVITRGTERIMPFPSPVNIVDDHGTPVAMPTPVRRPGSAEGA